MTVIRVPLIGQGPITISEPRITPADLDRQNAVISGRHLRLNLPPPDLSREPAQLGIKRKFPAANPLVGAAAAQPLADVPDSAERWEMSYGDPDSFYINLNGQLGLWGSTGGTRVRGEVGADSSILGQRLSLPALEGTVNSPVTGEMTATVEMKVLGNTLTLLDQKSLLEEVFSGPDRPPKPVEYSYKTRFFVGPVPMSFEVGARGTAGVKYSSGLGPAAASLQVTPYVHPPRDRFLLSSRRRL